MLLKPNTNVVEGVVLNADGSVANKPTTLLSADDAKLLREYKKFLSRMGWREALYCNQCYEGNLSDGMRVFVTDAQIMAECRHRLVFHQGQSF